MAEGMNKVYLIGNLGADAELSRYPSGNKLTMRLATTERWKDKQSGEKREKTEWHRCVLWGPRADKLEAHLTKGTTLFIEGRIESRSYEKDGQMKYTTEIRALDVKFIGSSRRAESGGRAVAYDDVMNGHAEPPPYAGALA